MSINSDRRAAGLSDCPPEFADFTRTMMTVDPASLGWLGTARQVMIGGADARVKAAIVQRAAELGIKVDRLEAGPYVTIVTGTAREHLGADKLCAYIDGLTDALNGSYGNPPVEVGRKDLERVLEAAGRKLVSDDTAAAMARLRQVLDGQPGSAP